MASNILIEELMDIVQKNSKETIKPDEFKMDLLSALNLEDDEIDRALSIMIAQATINPESVGTIEKGNFKVSPSFTEKVISTIKSENKFIEGKAEYVEHNGLNSTNIVGEAAIIGTVIFSPEAIDKMLNNFGDLSPQEVYGLWNCYDNMNSKQRRKFIDETNQKLKQIIDDPETPPEERERAENDIKANNENEYLITQALAGDEISIGLIRDKIELLKNCYPELAAAVMPEGMDPKTASVEELVSSLKKFQAERGKSTYFSYNKEYETQDRTTQKQVKYYAFDEQSFSAGLNSNQYTTMPNFGPRSSEKIFYDFEKNWQNEKMQKTDRYIMPFLEIVDKVPANLQKNFSEIIIKALRNFQGGQAELLSDIEFSGEFVEYLREDPNIDENLLLIILENRKKMTNILYGVMLTGGSIDKCEEFLKDVMSVEKSTKNAFDVNEIGGKVESFKKERTIDIKKITTLGSDIQLEREERQGYEKNPASFITNSINEFKKKTNANVGPQSITDVEAEKPLRNREEELLVDDRFKPITEKKSAMELFGNMDDFFSGVTGATFEELYNIDDSSPNVIVNEPEYSVEDLFKNDEVPDIVGVDGNSRNVENNLEQEEIDAEIADEQEIEDEEREADNNLSPKPAFFEPRKSTRSKLFKGVRFGIVKKAQEAIKQLFTRDREETEQGLGENE